MRYEWFDYPLNLHISQTDESCFRIHECLIIL